MVNLKINKLPNLHIVDRYMETVLPLGVKMDALGLDYFIPEKDEVPVGWLPEPFRAAYVVYAIGAQHETKKLPLRRMIELCDRINRPIVLLGGKEDREKWGSHCCFDRSTDGEEVTLKELNKRTCIFNACGQIQHKPVCQSCKGADFVFARYRPDAHCRSLQKEVLAFGAIPFQPSGCILPDPIYGIGEQSTGLQTMLQNRLSKVPKRAFPVYE